MRFTAALSLVIQFGLATIALAQSSTGSGFLLSDAGLVATNYHVIEGADKIEVVFSGKAERFLGEVVVKDVRNDLAVLKVRAFEAKDWTRQRWLSFGEPTRPGEEVVAFGYPFGDVLGSTVRLSRGTVNAVVGLGDDPRLLNIDNPIQPGNSGGPLISKDGQLAGVVVARLNAKYFYENLGALPENVNFAVKATYLRALLELLPEGEAIIKRRVDVGTKVEQLNATDLADKFSPLVAKIYSYTSTTRPSEPAGTSRNTRYAYVNLQKLANDSALGKRLSARVQTLKTERMSRSSHLRGNDRARFDKETEELLDALQKECQGEFQRKLEPVLADFAQRGGFSVIFSETDVDGILWAPAGKTERDFEGIWGKPGDNVTDRLREAIDALWR